MLKIKDKYLVSTQAIGNHEIELLDARDKDLSTLIEGLGRLMPEIYADPDSVSRILQDLGKVAAANYLRIKVPQEQKIRSGDVGETIAIDYIEEFTEYHVPIRKLRWRDHQNMAMRGDDAIGIRLDDSEPIKYLKSESKSKKALSTEKVEEARKELDQHDGKPSPHALMFIADRLRESGNVDLAGEIEKSSLLDGIKENQVKHLTFVLSESPESLIKVSLERYEGDIPQKAVHFRVKGHQKVVDDTFKEILDGIDRGN